ncbi:MULTISPECIES: OmpA family protein [unclassified Microbulbifer]|uniref:OmpA family protein n=1 Tax=unclassified Microbulbifer TaxID=2619833 RepID=UPI0027E516AF|nr:MULTISPECIES: OmpA family protein [unclassified Microbulbifer]
MKKALMAVALGSLITTGAQAEEFQGSKLTQAKQATVFTGAAIAGAAVGGPVGFIAGALGGAWLGEQIEQAEEATMLASQLTESRAELSTLAQQLDAARLSANDASELAVDSLQFQLLFTTGDDQLQEGQLHQLSALADFLQRHPQVEVHLEGRADPRGSDGYNNVLSDQRALSVQRALETFGVNSGRINRRALGASQSQAPRGDADAYALERRVDIHFSLPESMAGNF